ncbi:MAG: hypothetical protein ACXVDK_07160 [Bacteroidia bacterium]
MSAQFNETRLRNALLVSLLIKALYLLWQVNEYAASVYPGCHLALVDGDALEYIAGAENIRINGLYYPDIRMPGYPVLLSALLSVFQLTYALDLLVLLQLAISAISVVVLANTAFLITRSRLVFTGVFCVYLFSTYISVYDKFILTESLSISFIIFSVYYFVRGFSFQNMRSLIFCGGFAALAVFLRPALFILLLSYAFFLLIQLLMNKAEFRRFMLYGCYIVLPFLILDAVWIKRNFEWHHKFIPLMSFDLYDKQASDSYYREEVRFVEAWGGDIVHWEPKAEIRWFGCGRRFAADPAIRLPDYIYTSVYNADSLLHLRHEMRRFDQDHDPALKKTICDQLQRYTVAFMTEKKFTYLFIPFRYVYKLVLNSGGTFNLFSRSFSQLGIADKLLKIAMILLYESIAIAGCLLACVWLFRFRSHPFLGLLSCFIVADLVLIAFGFRMCEYRYFAPNYPFCILLIIAAIQRWNALSSVKSRAA